MRNGGSSFVILRVLCGLSRLGQMDLLGSASRETMSCAGGRRLCLIGSTGSTATRITGRNGRRKNPERSRQETKPSVHDGFRCLAHAPFPDARSVELSCNQSANPCSSVPSVASHFILASSVRTSIHRAGSSAHNPSQRVFRARMKSMNVRSIPCG